MLTSDYRHIKFQRRGRILSIVLDRSEALNCIDRALHEELARVFLAAGADPDSDVIVLTGAGRAFCAGGDLKELHAQLGRMPAFVTQMQAMRNIVYGILDCPKPMIARVNGDAIGLGATLALLCDMIIAVPTAKFADPHVKVGLSAGDGSALIWPQLVGFARAKQYLLSGDALDAVEAERIGLINLVAPESELDALVNKYADKFAAGAQSAVRYTKLTTNIALRQLFNSVFEAGVAYEGLSRYTNDYSEGLTAFLEKRKPRFSGQ